MKQGIDYLEDFRRRRMRQTFVENCRFKNIGPLTIPAAAAAPPFEFKPLMMHCMTLGCDFEYESSPMIAQPLGCPKCGGTHFGTTIRSSNDPFGRTMASGGFAAGPFISVGGGASAAASPPSWQEQPFEELELSPVQAECWTVIEERRARLVHFQRRAIARRWLRQHRTGIAFWCGLAAFMAAEAAGLLIIARVLGIRTW